MIEAGPPDPLAALVLLSPLLFLLYTRHGKAHQMNTTELISQPLGRSQLRALTTRFVLRRDPEKRTPRFPLR